MAFFSSLPILLIEMIATLQLGEMTNILDTVVFVLQGIGSLVGMTIGWIAYLRFVSRNLQQFRGPERQIVDENTELPTRTTQIIMVTPVRGQPTHI
ncbi:hypothetical protein AGDE_04173 [Angomonas deanei]|uniref:Uncharacterized protein n=1 Tax=Angomonas deanei TaxID=59799 RepID=A0A7G2CGQ6_9TRYP|nr:hypothetical protein AGDE_04173 [Angomonas deanei]CAD2219058.1 hypothetical protein, conserved [Angomonas deanei]|eukprot:EPY39755.1 hypothetical protein AGDE_04173 [Angomonas deanei]